MKMLRNVRIRKASNTKMLYLLTFFIIYLSDSLLFATNANEVFLKCNRFGLIIIVLLMLANKLISKNQNDKIPVWLLVLSLSILISSLLAGRIVNGYSYYTMIAALWFGYLFSNKYSLEQFSHCFCKIMRIIAIVSLLAWLFSDVIRSMGDLPTITNTVGAQYKTLFLTNVPMLAQQAKRNMGPFWEPGAYQVYLSVALFFTMFMEKHKSKWIDAVLFIVAALSTLSGAALIPILLIIAAYMFEKKNLKRFTLVMLLFGLMFVLFNTGTFDEITAKMGNDLATNSIMYRWIGIEGGIRGFLHNPLFGSAPEMNESIKMQLAMQYMNQTYASNTNTFFNYLAYYGMFVGGFMLFRSYELFKNNVASTLAVWLTFGAYLFTTSNENMMASLLIVVLVFLKNKNELQIAKVEDRI